MPEEQINIKVKTNLSNFNTGMKSVYNSIAGLGRNMGSLVRKGLSPVNNMVRRATSSMGRFKMELLSVMFGGMMLQKAMFGLLKPALQAVGVFELWTAILQIAFLPIAMKLLDWSLKFLQWWNELDPAIQGSIGNIVLAVGAFGLLLKVYGSLGLFISGLIKAFFKFKFLLMGLGLGLIIGGFILFKDEIKALWETLKKSEHVQALKSNLSEMWNAIKTQDWSAAWDSFKAAAGNVWDLIKELWAQIDWSALWATFKTSVNDLWNWFLGIAGGIYTRLKDKLAAIDWKGLWSSTIFKISDMISVLGDWIQVFKNKLVEFMSNIDWSKVWEWVFRFTEDIGFLLGKLLGTVLREIIEFLTDPSAMWELAKAIAGVLAAILGGIWKFIVGFFKGSSEAGESMKLGGKQTGGYVPHTGLYKLHAGENVNQSGDSNFSPNITVNASSNVDIEMLKRQLSSQWNEELTGMSRR